MSSFLRPCDPPAGFRSPHECGHMCSASKTRQRRASHRRSSALHEVPGRGADLGEADSVGGLSDDLATPAWRRSDLRAPVVDIGRAEASGLLMRVRVAVSEREALREGRQGTACPSIDELRARPGPLLPSISVPTCLALLVLLLAALIGTGCGRNEYRLSACLEPRLQIAVVVVKPKSEWRSMRC